jgi:hypothetical protein
MEGHEGRSGGEDGVEEPELGDGFHVEEETPAR